MDVSEYGPCPGCKEWLKECVIQRHQATCIARDEGDVKMTKGSLLVQSKCLKGVILPEASRAVRDEVFAIMQHDHIGQVVREDPLIVCLGNEWMSRNVGNWLMRRYYTSCVM